jgi:hypothetical protein
VKPDSAIVTALRTDGSVIEGFSIKELPDPPPLSIPDPKRIVPITIYTIPSVQMLVIDMDDNTDATVTLLNTGGKMVLEKSNDAANHYRSCLVSRRPLFC